MKIALVNTPQPGFMMAIDGQVFEFIKNTPHTKRDGQSTTLMTWKTLCAECGDEFISASPFGRIPETRRCATHRKPGVRVNQ